MEMSSGIRVMQTFRKLPTMIPNRKKKTAMMTTVCPATPRPLFSICHTHPTPSIHRRSSRARCLTFPGPKTPSVCHLERSEGSQYRPWHCFNLTHALSPTLRAPLCLCVSFFPFFFSPALDCKLLTVDSSHALVRAQNPPLRAPPLDHRRQPPRPTLPLGPRTHRRLP